MVWGGRFLEVISVYSISEYLFLYQWISSSLTPNPGNNKILFRTESIYQKTGLTVMPSKNSCLCEI